MLFIPGKLIGLITFPGIIAHELGHIVMCKVANVKVNGWCLLRWKDPMGFVVHEKPSSVFKSFLITFGPFLFNSLLAVLIIIIAGLASFVSVIAGFFFLWLALSIGMHAFPSFQDGKSLLAQTVDSIKSRHYLSVVFLPFVGLVYLGGALSFFWADLIYAGFLMTATLSFFTIPLFFNLSEVPKIEVHSEFASVAGCKLYFDGKFIGETTEKNLSLPLPKDLINAREQHTVKCDFVGCREWKIDNTLLRSPVGTIHLNWDDANFIDCKTNKSLSTKMVDVYKTLEKQFTEKSKVKK